MVEIDGLESTYTSCALVRLSIKNISHQEVYVEVYAEKFESGSWDDVDYPYDIKDPKSRYIKRIIINPDMLKPGASLPLTYDRCLRPTFVKESDKRYRKAIIEKDSKAATPALQRFRACTACSVCSCPFELSPPGRLITQEHFPQFFLPPAGIPQRASRRTPCLHVSMHTAFQRFITRC